MCAQAFLHHRFLTLSAWLRQQANVAALRLLCGGRGNRPTLEPLSPFAIVLNVVNYERCVHHNRHDSMQ